MSELQDMLRVQARLHRKQGANALGQLFESAIEEIQLLKKTYNQLFDAFQDCQGELAKANEQIESLSIKNAELVEPLKKCPITRRKLFMVIDGKPTYGGPYDSYTIPLMEGSADEKWHERELRVERFDHDEGGWSDDEIIPMRIISEEYLYEIEEKLAKANDRLKESEQINLELAANVESCCELVDMDIGAAIERLFEIDNTESKALLNKFAIEKKIDLLSKMVSSASDYMFNHDKLDIRANHLDMLLKNFCNYHREQLRKEQE